MTWLRSWLKHLFGHKCAREADGLFGFSDRNAVDNLEFETKKVCNRRKRWLDLDV